MPVRIITPTHCVTQTRLDVDHLEDQQVLKWISNKVSKKLWSDYCMAFFQHLAFKSPMWTMPNLFLDHTCLLRVQSFTTNDYAHDMGGTAEQILANSKPAAVTAFCSSVFN